MEEAQAQNVGVPEECVRSWDTGWSVAGNLVFPEEDAGRAPTAWPHETGNRNEAQLMSHLQCVCACVYTYIATKRTRAVREESSPEWGSEFISMI